MERPVSTHVPELKPWHRQAMAMRFQSKTYSEISKVVNLSIGTVKNAFTVGGACHDEYPKYVDSVMNRPVPVEQTNAGAVSVAERIKGYASTAVDKIGQLITHAKHEDIQLSAAKDIMDRAGYMPVQKMLNIHAVEEMSINELDSFISGILGNAAKNIAPNKPVGDRLLPDPANHTSQFDADHVVSTPISTPAQSESLNDVVVPDLTDIDATAYVDADIHDSAASVGTEGERGV